MSVIIKGYTLVNEAKVRRVYDKDLGVGKGATDEQILAYYAKFGGLIKKDDKVIDNGLFWDFKNKKPVEVKKEVKEVKEEVKVKKVKKAK